MQTQSTPELEETDVVLIAMESGALWPSWARAATPGAVVVAQQPGEAPHAFARRVTHRVEMRSSQRCRIRSAVIAVSPTSDVDSFAARGIIARAAIAGMPASEDGELILTVSQYHATDLGHELLGLAGALCDQLRGARVAVRVRFDGPTLRAAPVPRESSATHAAE